MASFGRREEGMVMANEDEWSRGWDWGENAGNGEKGTFVRYVENAVFGYFSF